MQRKRQGEGTFSNILSKVLLFLIILLVVIVGLIAYKLLMGKEEVSEYSSEPSEQLSEEQISVLLGRVARHIKLPDEQDPLIATINDADALRAEQGFYRDAKNGDQLIIFSERAMAFIYRPSEDILVNVGPIFFDDSTQPQPKSEIGAKQPPGSTTSETQPSTPPTSDSPDQTNDDALE